MSSMLNLHTWISEYYAWFYSHFLALTWATILSIDSVNYTRCTNNTSCQFIKSSQCNNYTQLCECQIGYTPDFSGTSCRESEFGDPCSSSDACRVFIDNSTCDTTRKQCVCSTGFKSVTITTYNATTNISLSSVQCELRKLGDKCTSDAECSSAVVNSTCTQTNQDVSQTPSDRSNSSSNETTITTTPVSVTTAASVSTCSCTQGYESANSNTSCNCLFTNQGRCLPVKIDFTSCTSNTLCTTYVSNSECINGVCSCKSGFVSEQGGDMCKDQILGSKCKNDSDCSDKLSNTECFNSICDCITGFVSNTNRTACIPCEWKTILILH